MFFLTQYYFSFPIYFVFSFLQEKQLYICSFLFPPRNEKETATFWWWILQSKCETRGKKRDWKRWGWNLAVFKCQNEISQDYAIYGNTGHCKCDPLWLYEFAAGYSCKFADLMHDSTVNSSKTAASLAILFRYVGVEKFRQNQAVVVASSAGNTFFPLVFFFVYGKSIKIPPLGFTTNFKIPLPLLNIRIYVPCYLLGFIIFLFSF